MRLSDNPALKWAVGTGCPVIPVFILDEDTGDTALGGASSWWLHGSLDALATTLRALGSRLVLRRGRADAVLNALFKETGAKAIDWNRLTEPAAIARDCQIKVRFAAAGIVTRSFNAALLFEPWTDRADREQHAVSGFHTVLAALPGARLRNTGRQFERPRRSASNF